METMKVYIKPWKEALKCAKESGVEHLVGTFDGTVYVATAKTRL